MLFPADRSAHPKTSRGGRGGVTVSPRRALNMRVHIPETGPAQHQLPIGGSAHPDPSVHFSYQKKVKLAAKCESQALGAI